MTRFVVLLPCVLACSSAASRPGDDSGAPPADAAASDAAKAPDSTPSGDGGADGSVTTDGGDGGLDPFVPHPPAGATKCGEGGISASSSQTTCTEPSYTLDDVPLPDGGTSSMPRDCSALDVGAGEWQVWCTATDAYVWARIPVTNNGSLQDCHGESLLMIDYGLFDSGSSGGNGVMVATYESDGTEIAGTTPGDPQTVVASITLPTTQSGAASVFVAGDLEDTCGTWGEPTVLAGFDATWTH